MRNSIPLYESRPDNEHETQDRKLAVPPIDLVPIYFMLWGSYHVGCPSSVTFSYNVALHHLMCKDKAVSPTLEEKLTALGLWEGGF